MTTDPFTEAARAEAEWRYPALNPDAEELTYPRSVLREHKRSAHVAGWEAARARLAAQEPTDAEVLAAAWAICRLQDDGYEPAEDHPCGACAESARAALSAARAARRDEEDKP